MLSKVEANTLLITDHNAVNPKVLQVKESSIEWGERLTCCERVKSVALFLLGVLCPFILFVKSLRKTLSERFLCIKDRQNTDITTSTPPESRATTPASEQETQAPTSTHLQSLTASTRPPRVPPGGTPGTQPRAASRSGHTTPSPFGADFDDDVDSVNGVQGNIDLQSTDQASDVGRCSPVEFPPQSGASPYDTNTSLPRPFTSSDEDEPPPVTLSPTEGSHAYASPTISSSNTSVYTEIDYTPMINAHCQKVIDGMKWYFVTAQLHAIASAMKQIWDENGHGTLSQFAAGTNPQGTLQRNLAAARNEQGRRRSQLDVHLLDTTAYWYKDPTEGISVIHDVETFRQEAIGEFTNKRTTELQGFEDYRAYDRARIALSHATAASEFYEIYTGHIDAIKRGAKSSYPNYKPVAQRKRGQSAWATRPPASSPGQATAKRPAKKRSWTALRGQKAEEATGLGMPREIAYFIRQDRLRGLNFDEIFDKTSCEFDIAATVDALDPRRFINPEEYTIDGLKTQANALYEEVSSRITKWMSKIRNVGEKHIEYCIKEKTRIST